MEFKGTKGKWLIENSESNGMIPIDQAFNIVAEPTSTDIGWDICSVWKDAGYNSQEPQANAKLISKAPEILNFLIKLKQEWKEADLRYGGENFHMEEITNLIKEATEL